MNIVNPLDGFRISRRGSCGAINSGANRIPGWRGPHAAAAFSAAPRTGTFARAGKLS